MLGAIPEMFTIMGGMSLMKLLLPETKRDNIKLKELSYWTKLRGNLKEYYKVPKELREQFTASTPTSTSDPCKYHNKSTKN